VSEREKVAYPGCHVTAGQSNLVADSARRRKGCFSSHNFNKRKTSPLID